jgi:5-methylcytosine-specific restriction endonuclease McrA
MAAKKRTRRVPKRLNTPFLTTGVTAINNEIAAAYSKVTAKDKKHGTVKKITVLDAEDCYRHHRGKCVYCDTRLTYVGRSHMKAARLMFYVPLKVGGEARLDNLIIVCVDCKHSYRDTRKLRTDIVGLDSFADCCEQLFIAVRDGYPRAKVDMLKNRINTRLSDVATCMRYVTTPDWRPITMEKLVEGENTMAEALEDMGKGKDAKAAVTNKVKQVVTTGQYKIMREPTDE